jgi:hypothetical protein
MPAVLAQDLADLVEAVRDKEGSLRFSQIAQSLQDYEVMRQWLKKDRVIVDGGVGFDHKLMTKYDTSARHQGLLDVDVVHIPELLTSIRVDYVLCSANWAILDTELDQASGKEQIMDHIKTRRMGVMIGMAEELERVGWADPDAGDKTLPWVIKYWIVKNSTEGFNGGLPSGFSSMAGVSLTAHPTFKNYTARYNGVSKTDPGLVRKMKLAYRKMGWKSPISGGDADYKAMRRDMYKFYSNEEVYDAWELLLENQNDNLGYDLKPIEDGTPAFRGHPLVWVPKLDDDDTNPVYMVNHSAFFPIIQKGYYLREKTTGAPNQHMISAVTYVDLYYNFICVDRRRQAVLYEDTTLQAS